MLTVPATPNRLRWLIILYGISVFIWLGQEDNQTTGVAFLGTVGGIIFTVLWIQNRWGGKRISVSIALTVLTITGSLGGAGSAIWTAGLMLFKNVRHAHIFPDYPFEMIGAMLARAPAWAIAGGLIGLAIGLLWSALYPEPMGIPLAESQD
jgi:hypothetical protein